MADSENTIEITQEHPEVTFTLERRQCTHEQREAAKRLFKRLIARTQSSLQTKNKSAQVDTKT